MKTVKQRDIRGFHATYRDNGNDAPSFYACSFYFLDDGRELWLTASVFDAPGYVAVNSGNLSQRWKATDFEPALHEAIELTRAAQSESLQGPTEKKFASKTLGEEWNTHKRALSGD